MCVQDPLEVCHAKLQIQPSSWLLQVCLATMSGEPLTIQHKDGDSVIDIYTDRLVPTPPPPHTDTTSLVEMLSRIDALDVIPRLQVATTTANPTLQLQTNPSQGTWRDGPGQRGSHHHSLSNGNHDNNSLAPRSGTSCCMQ